MVSQAHKADPTNRRHVLITGGAGYVGSVLVYRLLDHGYRVRVLDNLTFGGESLLAALPHPRFQLLEGDIREREHVDRALTGIDAVVHLAAIVGDPACAQDPATATSINQTGTEQVLMRARHNRVKRFVFASTCSNYGRMPDPEGFVDEDSPLNPISLYAELKVAFERRVIEVSDNEFCGTCLRFATAYGLSPRPRFDLTVNEFTRELACGRPLEVYGEQFWRPYCHTTDLARACQTVLEAPSQTVSGKAFNVGSNTENYRKKDLVEMISRVVPGAAQLVSYVHRDEDPRDYRVRFNRIARDLDFEPKMKVVDGINEISQAVTSGTITDPFLDRYRNT